jgi:hypothetical protein
MARQTVLQVIQLLLVLGIMCVTLYTESHVEPVDLIYLIHIGYIPMAHITLETALNMPLMRKVDITGHRIHFIPSNRLFLLPIIPDFGNFILDIDRRPVKIEVDVAPHYVSVAAHAFFK